MTLSGDKGQKLAVIGHSSEPEGGEEGALYYNTGSNLFYYYNDDYWREFGGSATIFTIQNTGSLASGLTTYYKCDTSGSFPDELGSFDGTIYGATYTASGKINGAYSYAGDNDYITIGTGTDFTTGSEGTITGWFKINDTNNNYIISKDDGTNKEFAIFYVNDVLYANLFSDVTGIGEVITGSVLQNTWYHFGFTWNNGSTEMYLYGSNTDSQTYVSKNTGVSAITYLGRCSTNYFCGSIDEIGIWDRTLGSNEISSLYNDGSGLPYD